MLYYAGNGWIVGSKMTPDGREIVTVDGRSLNEEFIRVFA